MVVAVGKNAALRGPREEDGHDFRPRIVDDLREAENRVLEAVVETMDKHQHLLFGRCPHQPAEGGERLRAVVVVGGIKCHEIRRRIAGNLVGIFNIAWLVHRGNRNNNIGKIQPRPAKTGKHLRRLGPHARRRDQHFHLARAGSARGHGLERTFWGSTTGEAANRYDNDKKVVRRKARTPNAGRQETTKACSPRPKSETTHQPTCPKTATMRQRYRASNVKTESKDATLAALAWRGR